MDTSVWALVAGLLALALSSLHCFWRRDLYGRQTWEMVYEPTVKGKDSCEPT
jgi:hypothetical protein